MSIFDRLEYSNELSMDKALNNLSKFFGSLKLFKLLKYFKSSITNMNYNVSAIKN